ncbi:MAG: BrnA antitoxin family protein [Candidatus Solibacter sp.]|nr:BrnA antitoxin family protein [Candidatus Solibacter sp.]
MTKLVRKTLADSPMTPARQRKLAQLAERPDSEIDFSDIPPLKESFWKNAVRNPFYRPVKQQLTVRLDADVVAWLRQQGRGYQTRLNRVLREAMLEDIKKSA